MNDYRYDAACAVFEGKIVVSGGEDLKSVESYDYYENKWYYLADMIEGRRHHASVSMGNKMFVIGGWNTTSTCEVFDSCSRKFTLIRFLMKIDYSYIQAVSLGKVIVVFSIPDVCYNSAKTKMFVYDTKSNEFSTIESKICENLNGISCVKYYSL